MGLNIEVGYEQGREEPLLEGGVTLTLVFISIIYQ